MNGQPSDSATDLILGAAQIERLNTSAVAMLDPLTTPSGSDLPSVGNARLANHIDACADTAREIGLVRFADLAHQLSQVMLQTKVGSASPAVELWVELAVAFCAGQLSGKDLTALVAEFNAAAGAGDSFTADESQALIAALQSESDRLSIARQQLEVASDEAGPEIGSDELDMLAQACAELGEELVSLEHSAPHQIYSLISERAGYFANAMRYMGLEPLANLFEHLIGRLQANIETGTVLNENHHQALMEWPGRWAAWFGRRRPEQLERALSLHERSLWHAPHLLAQARAAMTRLQLVGSRRTEQLPDDVEAADLSLEIPDDADQEVVENLLRELPSLTSEFTDAVTQIAADNGQVTGVARRVAHTIKGVANTVGVVGVANLTHALEDLLQLLEQAGADPAPGVIDTLCEASDCLSEMVESLSGLGPAPTNSLSIYQQVLAAVNSIADELEHRFQKQLAELEEQPSPQLDEDDELGPLPPESIGLPDGVMAMPEISLADFDLPELDLEAGARSATEAGELPDGFPTAPVEADESEMLIEVPVLGEGSDADATWMNWNGDDGTRLGATGRRQFASSSGQDLGDESESAFAQQDDSQLAMPTMRVPAAVIERLLESADEAVIAVSELQDIVKDVDASHRSLRDGSERLDALSVELDRLIDAGPAQPDQGSGKAGAQLDPLELERFTEIHTVSRRITEVAADSKLIEQQIEHHVERASAIADKLERVQSLVRDGALRARMVDAGSIAPRLQRAARQAARASNKTVQLTVQGGETAVDGETLHRLVDSLAHLVRNAVDHGIEVSAERKSAGKAVQGEITVTFEREASAVSVIVEDDGAGLDMAAIERRARSLSLLPDSAQLDSRAAAQLILAPGFTTRIRPTQLSGRGIGLDVVNQTIRGLRGVISLQSEAGAGTRFELTLPLQLTSLSAFVMRSETHVVALSVRGIETILADVEAIEHSESGMRLSWGDRKLEVRRLDQVLGLPVGMMGSVAGESGHGDVVLVVRLPAGEPVAVLVPEPGQAREVVVRATPDYMPRLAGIDGVAVLGDGAVAAVIDLPEMLAATAGARPDPRRLGRVNQPMPICLVVDDSVSVRRAMAHFMLDLGLYCDAAADGLQAIQIAAKRTPDLVVIDLEMPRMNGIELTQALRRNEATRNVPIIMITSRHSEKHRAMATAAGVTVFMTKPYTEDELASVVGTCLAG